MARYVVGTDHVQVAPHNAQRLSLSIEFISDSVIAGNTGKVYGKFGSAPQVGVDSNSWDFVLNPGAIDGTNQGQSLPSAPNKEEVYLISDTAGQVLNVVERSLNDSAPPKVSGAAAT